MLSPGKNCTLLREYGVQDGHLHLFFSSALSVGSTSSIFSFILVLVLFLLLLFYFRIWFFFRPFHPLFLRLPRLLRLFVCWCCRRSSPVRTLAPTNTPTLHAVAAAPTYSTPIQARSLLPQKTCKLAPAVWVLTSSPQPANRLPRRQLVTSRLILSASAPFLFGRFWPSL